MELKPGDRIRIRKSNTVYRVLALTHGDNVWVSIDTFLGKTGGLVWNGRTGEPWKDWFTLPRLERATDCTSA